MGDIIKATVDGREEEYKILNRDRVIPNNATHFINLEGSVRKVRPGLYTPEPNFLRLVRPRHTFGGVTFEETGERRTPKEGEWFLTEFSNGATFATVAFTFTTSILRPVSVVDGLA